VFVGGYEFMGNAYAARIWKNGVATSLTDGARTAFLYSVFVENGTVYAAGVENNGSMNVAKLWKNGVVTNLTDGRYGAVARSVFVVTTEK